MDHAPLTIDEDGLRGAGARLVVLFGSRARDNARISSDVDVGVFFGPNDESDQGARTELVRAALRASGEIDLVVLDETEPILLREVATNGRPVYECRPGEWEEFRIRAVKRYFDTAWIRKIEAEALRARYG